MIDPAQLDAVLFDLDDTLLMSGSHFVRRIVPTTLARLFEGPRSLLAYLEILITFRRVREAFRKHPCVPRLHTTQMEATADRVGVGLRAVQQVILPLIYQADYSGCHRYVEHDLEESLRALMASGLRLGVLSDYPVRAKLAGMRMDHLDWKVLLSAEDVDALKPQPALFLAALDRLGIVPERALYVGDRLDTDVYGARAVGLKTCLLQRAWREGGRGDWTVSSVRELTDRLLQGRWAAGRDPSSTAMGAPAAPSLSTLPASNR